jgi:hypothetical protein
VEYLACLDVAGQQKQTSRNDVLWLRKVVLADVDA